MNQLIDIIDINIMHNISNKLDKHSESYYYPYKYGRHLQNKIFELENYFALILLSLNIRNAILKK